MTSYFKKMTTAAEDLARASVDMVGMAESMAGGHTQQRNSRLPTSQKNKLEKMLGQTNFEADANAIVSGEVPQMQPSECAGFWNLVTMHQTKAGCFANVIILYFCKFYKDTKKAMKKHVMKDNTKNLERHLHSLINTLIILDVYGGMDVKDKDIRVALAKFEEFDKEHAADLMHDRIYYRFRTVVSELVKKGSSENSDHRSVAYYIIEVTQFDDPQAQMQMMMGSAPAAPEPRDILGSTYTQFQFMLPSLKIVLRRTPKDVFDALVKTIVALEGLRSTANIESTRRHLVAHLQLLRHFITLCPTTDIHWLEDIGKILSAVYKWPLPYSIIARDFLMFIEDEIKAPGSSLRELLHAEVVGLDPRQELAARAREEAGEEGDDEGRAEEDADEALDSHRFGEGYCVLVDGTDALAVTYAAMLDDNHHVDMVSALDVMGGGAGFMHTTRDRPSSIQYNSYTLGDELKDEEEEDDDEKHRRFFVYQQRKQCLMHILSCDFDLFPPTLADDKPPNPLDLERMDTEATASGSSTGMRAAAAGVVSYEDGPPKAPDPLGLDTHEDSFNKVAEWYGKALDILDKAKTYSSATSGERVLAGGRCKEYREAFLQQLLKEIVPDSWQEFPPSRCGRLQDGRKSRALSSLQSRESNNMSNNTIPIRPSMGVGAPMTTAEEELPTPPLKEEKSSPSKRVSMSVDVAEVVEESDEHPPPIDGNEPVLQPGFNNMFTPMLPPMQVDIQRFVDPSTPLPGVRVPSGEGEFFADNEAGGFIVYDSQADRNLKERIIRKADQIAREMALAGQVPASYASASSFTDRRTMYTSNGGAAGGGGARAASVSLGAMQRQQSQSSFEQDALPRAFMGESMNCAEHEGVTSLPCSSEALALGASRDFSRRKLKVAVIGSNNAMHRLLSCLQSVHSDRPEIFKDLLDLRIYVVPTGRNDVGRFLAWADKMYLRQVYSAFVDVPAFAPMYPRDLYPPQRVQDAELGQKLPAMLQKDALEDYIRFADQVYPVSVWNCVCWAGSDSRSAVGSNAGSGMAAAADPTISQAIGVGGTTATADIDAVNKMPDILIPFCSSAELGLHAQVAAHQKAHANDGTPSQTLEDLLLDKKDPFSKQCLEQPTLDVSYKSFAESQLGAAKGAAPAAVMQGQFTSLAVRNLPESVSDLKYGSAMASEVRGANGPHHRSVSVYYREHTEAIKGAIRSYRKPTDVFALPDIVRDEGKILDHLGFIEISSPEREGFHVLLDGAVHGPFEKIQIVPSELVMPMATYFPISNKAGE